jgi:hypothetical protein
MFSEITSHLVYQILNAPIRQYPFPHFFNTGMFPDAFYAEILKQIPEKTSYQKLIEQGQVFVPPEDVDVFEQRSVIELKRDHNKIIDESKRSFWLELTKILSSREFLVPLTMAFKPWIIDRFGEGVNLTFDAQIDLIRDSEKWALDPHTDQSVNIVVILLYLPPDDTTSHLGTSIYTPKNPGFTCEGGKRYRRSEFNCANTLPYLPNSAVGFFKNNSSFHGVESMKKAGDARNLIQLSVTKII